MVLVPAGEFAWGDRFGDGDESEKNGGTLYLGSFWIDAFPVTNADYARFLQMSRRAPTRFSGHRELSEPSRPVVGVSWQDASDYCSFVSKRLPSEFEWEKAARGRKGVRYPWGDASPEKAGVPVANYAAGASFDEDGYRLTAPLGAFPKNLSDYGVFEMVGNVWQWTSTYFDPQLNRKLPKESPPGTPPAEPSTGRERTVRGGSWANSAWVIRATTRLGMAPESREPTVGFRCAKSVEVSR